MIPKSTAKLKEYDAAAIHCENGGIVLLVFLWPKGRSYMFSALASPAFACLDDIERCEALDLHEHALCHIDAFKKNELNIEYNVTSKCDTGWVNERRRELEGGGEGTKNSVWGYKAVIRKANEMAAQQGNARDRASRGP